MGSRSEREAVEAAYRVRPANRLTKPEGRHILADVQATISRAVVGTVAVLVVLTLILDLLTFGPASHALDPTLPWLPVYIDGPPGMDLY